MEAALQPYFRRRYLLTKPERLFYKTLRRVVQQHIVLAKVRLADLIDANEQHHLWQANFNRIKSKHIDFVVCDAALAPIIAVELDDSSHERADRRARDRDVDQIFRFASLPILRVPARQSYDESEIEKQLLAKIREPSRDLERGLFRSDKLRVCETRASPRRRLPSDQNVVPRDPPAVA